jgi:hypothetical protein
MSTLLSTIGITFNDGSKLNSLYGIIPQSTATLFYKATAPTGWTQVTVHNDKALRVVSGTGAGSAGVSPFTTVFPSAATTPVAGTVGATTLTLAQMASHAHGQGAVNAVNTGTSTCNTPNTPGCWTGATQTSTDAQGGNGSHTHPIAATIDLRVLYVDVIICTFN